MPQMKSVKIAVAVRADGKVGVSNADGTDNDKWYDAMVAAGGISQPTNVVWLSAMIPMPQNIEMNVAHKPAPQPSLEG